MIEGIDNVEISRIRAAYLGRQESGRERRYTFSEYAHVLRIQEMQSRMAFLIATHTGPDLSRKRILEVGCGTGYWLRHFIQLGAQPENLFGIDLLPEKIAQAKRLCPRGVHLECGNASRISCGDDFFDFALQATVFTSVLDSEMKKALASEMARVLKRGGYLCWYDFFVNNPRNAHVRAVGKKEILKLFPGFRVRLERLSIAPPLGRILNKISPLAYHAASAMKVFSTHYLGLLEKL
jgi:ubiquinone/menaquinone biosynthesis C-methylase UbiE